jgi:hypothetical protein
MLISNIDCAAPKIGCSRAKTLENANSAGNWPHLIAKNMPIAHSAAIIDLTTARAKSAAINLPNGQKVRVVSPTIENHQKPSEIFGCDSRQLFVVKPLHGKLSEKDLSALETVVLLEGLRTIVILLDASSSIAPPPGYERLIWLIAPEYCDRQRQQELFQETTSILGRSGCLQKMARHLKILAATYNRETGVIQQVSSLE